MAQVLIADTDITFVKGLKEYLVRENVEVLVATNGNECIEMVRRNNISVVLSDLGFSDINGVELLRRILGFSGLQVIVVTSLGDERFAVDVLKNGAYEYFLKQVPFETILGAIEKAHFLSSKIEFLKEKRNNSEIIHNIKLPIEFRNAIHQYLIFFKRFVEKTKGKRIKFGIDEIENGLQIVLNPEQIEQFKLQEWLNEYLDFIRKDIEPNDVVIESNISDSNYMFLIKELKHQIEFYKGNSTLLQIKNEILAKENLRLNSYSEKNQYQYGNPNFFSKSRFKEKVGEGKSLIVLSELSNSRISVDYLNEVLLLKSQLSTIIKDSGLGKISLNEFQVEKSRIESYLLNLIDQIEI